MIILVLIIRQQDPESYYHQISGSINLSILTRVQLPKDQFLIYNSMQSFKDTFFVSCFMKQKKLGFKFWRREKYWIKYDQLMRLSQTCSQWSVSSFLIFLILRQQIIPSQSCRKLKQFPPQAKDSSSSKFVHSLTEQFSLLGESPLIMNPQQSTTVILQAISVLLIKRKSGATLRIVHNQTMTCQIANSINLFSMKKSKQMATAEPAAAVTDFSAERRVLSQLSSLLEDARAVLMTGGQRMGENGVQTDGQVEEGPLQTNQSKATDRIGTGLRDISHQADRFQLVVNDVVMGLLEQNERLQIVNSELRDKLGRLGEAASTK